jgi:16S rRNA (guanine1516-N2)-methyltransferase
MTDVLAVGYAEAALLPQAEILAHALKLPVDNHLLPRLSVTAESLVLLTPGFLPLRVDFFSQTLLRRKKAGRAQGLIQACRPKSGLLIMDVTAGWGRDAALLSSFGATVVMVERQPVMAALLSDGLTRIPASQKDSLHLSLVSAEAVEYLQSLTKLEYPDVIYMDPMHPVRQKSSKVKKEMQILQQLYGEDADAKVLLEQAITCARQRVVVKWPQSLAPLLTPHYSIAGKTVRFDVYRSLL